MYDIRQFKPALYLLVFLGISGFALAGQAPGIWALAVIGIGLNAWLVATGRFRPIPRMLANIVTVVSGLYVVREMLVSPLTPVIVIGEFLVFLQLVKLWEQRANRDYAQLLVLSLLLMVAASMNTASLWFGLLLIGYLFLSLYCCLLFHLKVETDAVKAAMPVPEEKIAPGTLRQDQRHLSRSMRRLTALVSLVSVFFAALIFLLFPRGTGAGLLGPTQAFRSSMALTGFSDQVTFQDVARISQSHETVAFVRVWRDGQPVPGNRTLLLRGLTLDAYHPPMQPGKGWEWTRSTSNAESVIAGPEDPLVVSTPGTHETWRQEVTLWPTHTDVLFAMPGVVSVRPKDPIKIRYSPSDGALQTSIPLSDRIDYEAVSTNQLGAGDVTAGQDIAAVDIRQEFPRVFQFASRPEVSGSDAAGPLAARRVGQGDVSPLDPVIAGNIEHYLRSHFAYTLDLTDEGSFKGREPLELFLYDWKRGHCEYFAGAMTLMCQSLGMQSRMVIGFKCGPENYNSFTGLYSVHDSDAHAWVEVRTPSGWQSFDPTSSIDAEPSRGNGWLTRGRHFMEYLEYTYANAIIAYDTQNRDSIVADVEARMSTTTARGSEFLDQMREALATSTSFWNASTTVLTCVLLAMILGVATACGVFTWERWRMRRRAQRIGIESLPDADQLRLARQLGFYDDMMRLLERHRVNRPAHLTPAEFGRSLTFLPGGAFDRVQRLTALYYKVRYGGVELPAARRRKLDNVLADLARELAPPTI